MVTKTAEKLGITAKEVFEQAATGRHDINVDLCYDYWILHGETPLFVLNYCRKILYEDRETVLMRDSDPDD